MEARRWWLPAGVPPPPPPRETLWKFEYIIILRILYVVYSLAFPVQHFTLQFVFPPKSWPTAGDGWLTDWLADHRLSRIRRARPKLLFKTKSSKSECVHHTFAAPPFTLSEFRQQAAAQQPTNVGPASRRGTEIKNARARNFRVFSSSTVQTYTK
jgi:hypothetical protein